MTVFWETTGDRSLSTILLASLREHFYKTQDRRSNPPKPDSKSERDAGGVLIQ